MKKVFLPLLTVLACGITMAQTPKRFDLIIHELFPDPSPQIGLPNSEFIELRNISGAAINLRNWKLSDGSSTATIASSFILQPDSCVVICPASALPGYAAFGSALSVSNFPSLNNDADAVWLISPDGRVIHAVNYEQTWYQNAVKSDGGWTLEMIDISNPCGSRTNWAASSNPTGGTPGKKNSVQGSSPDDRPPTLLRTYAIDSMTIAVVFDETVDSSLASNITNYNFNKGLVPARASPVPPLFRQVNVTTVTPLVRETVYLLTVTGVCDCAGNSIGMFNAANAGLPSDAGPEDIVINEVLFNPPGDGADYVEFYNAGTRLLDASKLFIGTRGITNDLVVAGKLSDQPFLVFPGDHIVVTENAALVSSRHRVRHPQNVLVMNKLPSLPDDKGSIALLNAAGGIVDELSYDEKWHFPLIINPEGVSLERIDARQTTQSRNNWASAAADAGYGTPTYRNSQYHSALALQGKVEVRPAVFSPDNDGFDDGCFVHYHLSAPNNMASITVFDLNGNIIRNLCNNASLSTQGFFRWDGLDNRGAQAPVGVYIVLTQLFNMQEQTRNFKNTVTLARRF